MIDPNRDPLLVSVRKQLDSLKVERSSAILIGVSGGPDSMVLLDALHRLGYSVGVAHVNYHLRGEDSALDASLVEEWCKQNQIVFYKKEVDTKSYAAHEGLNIQTAARNIRYQWWTELKEAKGYDYVATAHHRDDAVETSMMNFIRGTGLKGLKGIEPRREFFIRPLIGISKSQITRYTQALEIPFRNDASNDTDAYQRNKIRHHLIPLLNELSGNESAGIMHTLNRLNMEWKSFDDAYAKWKEAALIESSEGLTILFDHGELAFLLRWLEETGFPWLLAKDYIEGGDDGKILLHEGLQLSRNDNGFFLHKPQPFNNVIIPGPGVYPIEDGELSIEFTKEIPRHFDPDANTAYINVAAIQWPLEVRQVMPGDKFQPLGMHGKHKKLQDFLVDHKLDPFAKSKVRLLVSGSNILWVIGMRLDENSKINEGENEGYRLRYSKVSV